ncbi:uncharacterized protein si:ch211-197h24.6 [Conger conger]|uniref:uncharacterized protein si:ch211-197h24.6 n=1 Tax=Conger conger TaxID=82655 RepID=UPI002A5A0435|nr:uncharacterized protein si:ch211-197h24.6 [Conger conger]XP_061115336.1 uncharacterized protein si:ch211-197h24.6 [Conger conger]
MEPNVTGAPPAKKFKNGVMKPKRHQPTDIVFTTKTGAIQTVPSLEKRLTTVTEPVIGLQFVWEYRSPSKSVAPHYQCRLCKVQRLQNEMLAHVKGWKHSFRYMKKHHSSKVPSEEEEAVKDPAIRRAAKETAAEVEKAEGRGKIRVLLKEPFEIAAFQGMRSAMFKPKMVGPGGPGGPGGRFLGGYPDPMFSGEFPPRGMHPDFPMGMPMRRLPGDMPMSGFPDSMPMQRHGASPGRSFQGNMPMRMPGEEMGMKMRGEGDMGMRRYPDEMPMRMNSDGFGMGQRNLSPGRPYPDEFPSSQHGGAADRIMSSMPKGPESNSLPTTLLKYLDTFRIENENDAQIVLKVTQKLTDVLMEYRLRSVSTGSTLKSTSSSSMNFSAPRLPTGGDRYSGNSLSGLPSLSGPSRYYN